MQTKPYCEYNCDYPCSMCLETAKKAERAAKLGTLMDDGITDEDIADAWNSYIQGERTGHTQSSYPIQKFTETGAEAHKPWEPPPFTELKSKAIVEAKPIMVFGPTGLKHKMIITA
jgi:hypothetical protein